MDITSCNICGQALQQRFSTVREPRSGQAFSIAACPACGLGHTTPAPDDTGEYYDREYHGGRHGMTAAYCSRRRLRLVTKLAGSGKGRKLLDVGCGDGTFLLDARAAGWNVVGTELNASIARAAGLEVRPELADIAELSPFDCITLWHSLEHMRNPRFTICAARDLLAPNGLLMIAVPDARGWQASIFGARWFHLDVPRHLHHFCVKSLRRLLESCGFQLERTWHQEFEYDLLGWSQSALNCILPVPNLFFDSLTGRATSRLHKAVSWIGGVVFSVAALPLVVLGNLFRRGGTLVVAANHRES